MKKVNFLCLILLGIFFTACHSSTDTWGDWSKAGEFGGGYRINAVSFKIGNNIYIGMGYNSGLDEKDKNLKDFWKYDGVSWKRLVGQDYPDLGRKGAVAFVVDNKAYVGMGFRGKYETESLDQYFSDFYVFDGDTDSWITDVSGKNGFKNIDIADGGFDSVECAAWAGIGFSLNNKGYVGTGQGKNRIFNKIYCYDPATDKWSDSGYNDESRAGSVTFTIGNQVVLCLGNGDGSQYCKTVYVFDGANWTKQASLADVAGSWNDDYGKIPRSYAVAFTSNLDRAAEIGYIAGGIGNSNTCWEYHIWEDRWREVSKFPNGMAQTRVGAIGYTYNEYGYITTGGGSLNLSNDNSTWKFTPGLEEDDNNDY